MKTKIAIAIISLLLFFSYSEVKGADWIYIGKSIKNNRFYYDRESISRTDKDIVRTWEKIEFSDLSKMIGLLEINCKTRMLRTISVTKYNQVDGVESYSNVVTNWEYIFLESVHGKLHKILCK